MSKVMANLLVLCAAVVVLTMGVSNSVPVQSDDRDLTMYLTVVSGSRTAVPMISGSVTFRCDIQDYNEAGHFVTWTRFDSDSASWNVLAEAGTLKESAGTRFLVSRVQASDGVNAASNVHQRLVIDSVEESDQGLYRCNVMAAIRNSTSCNDETMPVASREMALTVYPSKIFPVCSPSYKAPDPLVPGKTLSCGTLTEDRTPVVTRRGNTAGLLEKWAKGARRDGRPGWELTKEVNMTDDGLTYDCWSFPTDFTTGEIAHSCAIEPHVVASTEPEPPKGLPIAAIGGIVAGVVILVLVIMTVCICSCKSRS